LQEEEAKRTSKEIVSIITVLWLWRNIVHTCSDKFVASVVWPYIVHF
jgi:hypothetical protein